MEAMAAESIVATAWELDGFLTKVRWPVRVAGGYSDIDVVGVDASGTVRLGECKVRGPARAVYVAPADFVAWLGEWGKCVENIERLWCERPGWLPSPGDVSQVEMWFCGNIWFATDDEHRAAEAAFTQMVRGACPHGLKNKAAARVVSTRDLFIDVVTGVRKRIVDEAHGKRFGNAVLDIVRELVRYTSPQPHDGGRVRDVIADETQRLLLSALGLSGGADEQPKE